MTAIPDAAMSQAVAASVVTPESVGSRLAIQCSFRGMVPSAAAAMLIDSLRMPSLIPSTEDEKYRVAGVIDGKAVLVELIHEAAHIGRSASEESF